MNGPADGPGPSSCALLNASGVDVMLRGSSIPLPANMPFHSAYGLANVITACRSSTPRVTDATRSAPPGLAIAKRFVLAAQRVDLGRDVLPRDRRAVGPDRFRVDGVGDDLRIGLGQFDTREVVGVQGGGAVGLDDECPRHRRLEHRRRFRAVAVDVQRVPVDRELAQREPEVAAVEQGGRVLRVDVVRGAELGRSAGGRSVAVPAQPCREHPDRDERDDHRQRRGDPQHRPATAPVRPRRWGRRRFLGRRRRGWL